MMRCFLIAILFLCANPFSSAQELHIVKDNVNCSFGLKNENGNWVVEPNYILIQEYNSGFFLVKDITGDGLLSPEGEWVIPCKYDRLYVPNLQWHVVRNSSDPKLSEKQVENSYIFGFLGNRKDLVTVDGKVLAQMPSHAYCKSDFGRGFLIRDFVLRTSTYIDISGEVLIDQIPGLIASFRTREYSLIGDKLEREGDLAVGNVRIINRKGEVQSDRIFEKAMVTTNDRICFEENSNYGVISISGEMIIPPYYQREIPLGNPDADPKQWVIVDSSGKKGIMKSDGSIFVDPTFEQITPIDGRARTQCAWLIEGNGKFGVCDFDGEWLVPFGYDYIFPFRNFHYDTRDYDLNFVVQKEGRYSYLAANSNHVSTITYDSIIPITEYSYHYVQTVGLGLITQKNGKYGILNCDGSVHAKCIYDAYSPKFSTPDRQYFIRKKELKEIIFLSDGVEERSWNRFLILDGKIVFENDGNHVLAIPTEDGKNIAHLGHVNEGVELFGNMLVVGRNEEGALQMYDLKKAKKLKLSSITRLMRLDEEHAHIITQEGKHGVMDQDGKLTIHPIYSSIITNRNSENIWAAKSYTDSKQEWVLLNLNGRKIVGTTFDYHFEVNSGDKFLSDNGEIGLMDTKSFKWKIKPEHTCLVKIVGQYYHVLSNEGKQGIIRVDGSYVLKPLYDSITLVSANGFNSWGPNQNKGEVRWRVQRGDQEFMVDQNGRQITDSSEIQAFFEALLFEDTLLFEGQDLIRNYPRIDYRPSLSTSGLKPDQARFKRRELWGNPLIKSVIFDSIHTDWVSRKLNRQDRINAIGARISGVHGSVQANVNQSCYYVEQSAGQMGYLPKYVLNACGKKYVSIKRGIQLNTTARVRHPVRYYQRSPNKVYWNFIEKEGQVVEVSLEDIFPNDSILMQEFIEALKQRDDLELECSSLENMLDMINGSFSLSDEGVILYLNQNQYNHYSNAAVELLIPLENLEKLAASKWIVPLLSNN